MKKIWRILLIILAVLLFVVLIGPFLVPVPPAAGTVPPQQLADANSQFVEIDGILVHYKMMGQGQPYIILLHGFGASLFSWHAVMEPLSQLGTVIAYDRPAFGLTERPMNWSGLNPYGPEGNDALLAGLMDYFGIQKAILIGNSAGGTLSMQFALLNPDRVQALILVDPAVYENSGPGWVSILGKTPEMQHLGPLIVRSIEKSGLDLIRTAWHDPSRITQETLDGYTKPLQAENWDRALWDFTMASHDSGLTSTLKDFSMPIEVITGEDDRIVPTADSIRLAGAIPNSKLVIIQNAGHVPHEEQPALFLQAVEEFIKNLRLTPTPAIGWIPGISRWKPRSIDLIQEVETHVPSCPQYSSSRFQPG
jgi:pimeloyl-ACP methyl ester carboxylesterase